MYKKASAIELRQDGNNTALKLHILMICRLILNLVVKSIMIRLLGATQQIKYSTNLLKAKFAKELKK